MFNLKYYEDKKVKLNEKLQKLIDNTFNTSAKLWADYYNERAELEKEFAEIQQLIKEQNMTEEEVVEAGSDAEVVETPAEEVAAPEAE